MGRRGPQPATPPPPPANAGKLPPPPAWLDPEAADEYRRIAAAHSGLTARDSATLANYAQALAEIAEHTRRLREEGPRIRGHRGDVLNPRIRARRDALAAMNEAAHALGLTPAARVKLPDSFDPSADPEPGSPEAFEAQYGSGPA